VREDVAVGEMKCQGGGRTREVNGTLELTSGWREKHVLVFTWGRRMRFDLVRATTRTRISNTRLLGSPFSVLVEHTHRVAMGFPFLVRAGGCGSFLEA
jgi:hypothetical protein